MSMHGAMSFVAHASPQELTKMVQTRDPYSFLALAKLQELRDNRMQSMAHQAPPPPLSATIPQQLQQMGPSSGGIASLQPTPMEDQQPLPQPQDMGIGQPQAPTQSPLGMATGGLVAFKEGGDTDEPSAAELWRREVEGSVFGRTRQRATRQSAAAPLTGQPVSTPAPAPAAETGIASPTIVPAGATTMMRDDADAGLMSLQNPVSTPAAQAPVSVAAGIPSAPVGGVPSSPLGNMTDIDRRLKEAYAPKEKFYNETAPGMISDVAKAAYNPEDFKAARGDIITDVKKMLPELKQFIPDHYKGVEDSLKKYHAEVEGDQAKAPYQAMMKMATSLMATKSSNFMTALGDAGGAGLEEYNKINELNKTRKMKLIEADAHMAAAQQARDQGNLQLALQQVGMEQQARMDEYHAKTNAKVQEATLKFQAAAHAAGVPAEKLKPMTEMLTAEAHLQSSRAQMINAGKPAAEIQVQQWMHDPAHPERYARVQSSEAMDRAIKASAAAEKQYTDEEKKMEETGQKMKVSRTEFVNDVIDRAMRNAQAYGQQALQNIPGGLRPGRWQQ